MARSRRRMTKRQSRKVFKRGARKNTRNFRAARGGYRL